MTTLDVFNLEYYLNRKVHGQIVSALLAIRVAIKQPTF